MGAHTQVVHMYTVMLEGGGGGGGGELRQPALRTQTERERSGKESVRVYLHTVSVTQPSNKWGCQA